MGVKWKKQVLSEEKEEGRAQRTVLTLANRTMKIGYDGGIGDEKKANRMESGAAMSGNR